MEDAKVEQPVGEQPSDKDLFEQIHKDKTKLEFSKDGLLTGTRHYGPRVCNIRKNKEPQLVKATAVSSEVEEGYCSIC